MSLCQPRLVVVSGLPGVGKTSIAKALAEKFKAVYLRVDSIEQAILRSSMKSSDVEDAGYQVAYALAADQLKFGTTVIADCVNPLQITRDAWARVADDNNAQIWQVEITCSDSTEHRRRVETRQADISGHELPTWDDVISVEYEEWPQDRIKINALGHAPEYFASQLRNMIEVE